MTRRYLKAWTKINVGVVNPGGAVDGRKSGRSAVEGCPRSDGVGHSSDTAFYDCEKIKEKIAGDQQCEIPMSMILNQKTPFEGTQRFPVKLLE